MLVSSSCSKDDYKSRRARSRTRKDVKSSKKTARRSSPKRGSIEAPLRAKKRKGSKKNDGLDAEKKAHKKKPRRDISDSSMSSDSWSCSTCQGGNSSSESEFERPRGRSERKGRDKRSSGKVKHFNERSRNRSRSCSSCSRCSESSGYQSVGRWDAENNSRRLRSVITVVKELEEEDGRDLDEDAHKEEIIYDHDDYPSCRSNDSNDGGGKRELTFHSEKGKQIESGKEAFVSDIRTTEDKESGKDCRTQNDGIIPSFHGVEESKSEASGDIGDLESILRQRAIENLRKFRGGVQTNAKTTAYQKDVNAAVKQSSTSKAELVQTEASKVDGTKAVSANQAVPQSNIATIGEEFSYSSRNLAKIPDGKYSKNEPEASEKGVVCPPEKLAPACAPKENDNSSATTVNTFGNKCKPRTSVLRQEESFGTSTSLKRASDSQESHRPDLLVARPSVNTNSAAAAQTEPRSSKDNCEQVSGTSGPAASNLPSELKSISGEQSSKEVQGGEAKEGSQFEQKTMSVMRGGEMVQVSNFLCYKFACHSLDW